MLNREHEVLTLSSKIQTDVASSIAKTQRDFFLREQMRAIQRELGEGEPNSNEIKTLREKIEQTPLPADVKKVATQELERLQQIQPAAAEYPVARNYLDWILNLPWEKSTDDKIDSRRGEKILNQQHFGLVKVKDRLLEFLAVMKRKRVIKGPILCLVGPPGVGKTSLGKSVADAWAANLPALPSAACVMKRKFAVIAALMWARCRGGFCKPCAASKATIPSSCSTSWTRSAQIFAAIPRPLCSKCSTPRRITLSPITISICRLICRACSSLPRRTGSNPFTPRCATGSKSSNSRATPNRKNCKSRNAISCRASWKNTAWPKRNSRCPIPPCAA
jgi:hypothetical protein